MPAVRSLSGSKNEDSCFTIDPAEEEEEAAAAAAAAPKSGVAEGPKCIFLLGGEKPKPAASN